MKFDVFVSFRGSDTRRTFVSHLMLSLFKKKITAFKHEKEVLENQPPSSQVLQAIEESKIAIAVISERYAASSCCLDELAKIFECKEKGTLEVVPVFYEVNPSDVLKKVNDLGSHGDGDDNLEKVKRWSDALESLIEIYHRKYSYWEDESSYSYIIDQVLIHVSCCLGKSETLIKEEYTLREDVITRFPHIIWSGTDFFCGTWNDFPLNIRESGSSDESLSDETVEDFEIPRTSLLSLLSAFVTKLSVIATKAMLVVAPLRTIAKRFLCGKESSGIKTRLPRSFSDVQNDNYVTCNNLSLFLSNDFNSFVGKDRLMKEMYTLLELESRDAILEVGILGTSGMGKTTLARYVYEQISPQFQDHHYFNDTINCSPGACLLDDIARGSLRKESESLDENVKAKLGHRKVLLIVDNMYESYQLENIRNISRWFGPGSRLIFVTDHEYLLMKCRVERKYVVKPLRYDEALQLFSQFAFKREQVPKEYYQLAVRAVTITGRIPLALKVFGAFLCGKHTRKWEDELCALEALESDWDCVGEISSFIGNALS